MLPRMNAPFFPFFFIKKHSLWETVALTLKSVARLGALWRISLVPVEQCRFKLYSCCVCRRHHAHQLINIITGSTAADPLVRMCDLTTDLAGG